MASVAVGPDTSREAPARPTLSAGGYTTFSPRLAPSLTVAGGVLAIIGGLGLWVRAVALSLTGVHQTATVTGIGHTWGWLIAGLGGLAVAGSIVRFSSSRWLDAAVSITAVVLMAIRVSDLSLQSSRMAFRAGADAGRAFIAYHAGFGWGAWAMTLAAVLLSLGTIVASLRALDERKGFAG